MTRAFTLLEVLVVLAALGVLLGIATPSMLSWRDRLTVERAAQEIGREIDRQRSEAKLRGAARVVIISAGVSTTYQAGTPASPTTLRLPGGAQLSAAQATTITLRPPYGTTEGGAEFTVRLANRPNVTRTVRVTSLLGKVVIQ